MTPKPAMRNRKKVRATRTSARSTPEGVTVTVVEGDITQDCADAIVNSTTETMSTGERLHDCVCTLLLMYVHVCAIFVHNARNVFKLGSVKICTCHVCNVLLLSQSPLFPKR